MEGMSAAEHEKMMAEEMGTKKSFGNMAKEKKAKKRPMKSLEDMKAAIAMDYPKMKKGM